MRSWKNKPWRTRDPWMGLMMALGAGVIGLSLLPEAHSAARQFAVGLELGLASVALILGVGGVALRGRRWPR